MKPKILKITLVIAVIFIIAASYLFLAGKTGEKNKLVEESVNSAGSFAETNNWKTYKNEKYGV